MVGRGTLLLLAISFLTGCKPIGVSPATKDKPQVQSITATESSKLLPPGNTPSAETGFPDVITSSTAYYTGGPQQGRPPDGTLTASTRVRVIEDAGSYSMVETANGIHAYISTGAIGKEKVQLGNN